MTGTFTAACVQVSPGAEIGPNIAAAADLIRRARDGGASLILTPENVSLIEPDRERFRQLARGEADSEALAAFRDLSRETGAWLLVGSLPIVPAAGDGDGAGPGGGDRRMVSRSFLLDPQGDVAARYDKMHLFDVDLPGGESYRESARFRPGERAVTADLPWGRIGLSICYDVRFADLYRALAKAGAGFLTVPAAFTVATGRAHWHVLLRARAIETGAYVFAPAQCGEHPRGRKTFGHSLIVDPWGEVLADGGEEPGFVIAEIDPARVDGVRRSLPSLTHDRPYSAPAVPGPRRIRAAGD